MNVHVLLLHLRDLKMCLADHSSVSQALYVYNQYVHSDQARFLSFIPIGHTETFPGYNLAQKK